VAGSGHPAVRDAGPAAAPGLVFEVQGAAVAQAAVPGIDVALRIARAGGGRVRSIALAVQVRIAAPRRRYDPATQERLLGLFGPPGDWGRSLRSILWARPTVMVPPFDDATVVTVPLPCTYDFEVGAAAYLDAVRDGHIPIELLFSGTVFYAGDDGRLQTCQLPWEHEASFAMPAALWREAMDRFFPGARWLRLDGERFDRLAAFRSRRALPSWEAAIDAALEAAEG
jgi:Family of unknown function (DUF6084)